MCSSWDVLCKPATMRRPFFRPLVRPASSDGRASRLANSSMNNHQRRWVPSGMDKMDVMNTSAHDDTSGFMELIMSSRQLIYRFPPSGLASQSRMENLPGFMPVCSDSLFDSTKRADDSALLASLEPTNRDSARVPSRNCFKTLGSSMVQSRNKSMMLASSPCSS